MNKENISVKLIESADDNSLLSLQKACGILGITIFYFKKLLKDIGLRTTEVPKMRLGKPTFPYHKVKVDDALEVFDKMERIKRELANKNK